MAVESARNTENRRTGVDSSSRVDMAMAAGTSRGVSNVVESTPTSVELEDGTLLAIFPGR